MIDNRMNRRKFIQRMIMTSSGLLLFQHPVFANLIQGRRDPSGCSASTSMTNIVTYDDWWSGNSNVDPQSNNFQRVQNSSSLTVCRADVYFGQPNSTATFHLEIWNIGATAQIGGDSNNVSLTTSDLNQLRTFTWSSNKPNITGDFRLCIYGTDAYRMGVGSGDTYAGSSYYITTAGTQRTGLDWIFEVFTE